VFDYKYLNEITTELSLGKYKLEKLPDDSKYESPDFGFSITYEQKENKVIMHRRLYINTLLLKNTGFNKWNEFIAQLSGAYKETVVLKSVK
jgi:hypothetical protein